MPASQGDILPKSHVTDYGAGFTYNFAEDALCKNCHWCIFWYYKLTRASVIARIYNDTSSIVLCIFFDPEIEGHSKGYRRSIEGNSHLIFVISQTL